MDHIKLFICFLIPLVFHNYELSAQSRKKGQTLKEEISSTPFKRANTITIIDTASDQSLLNKVAKSMAEIGYGIMYKDVETGIITSTEYGPRNSNVTIKIVGIVKDSIIILKGQFKLNVGISIGGVSSVPAYEEIRYAGMKGSPIRDAWDEMQKVAEMIGGNLKFSIN